MVGFPQSWIGSEFVPSLVFFCSKIPRGQGTREWLFFFFFNRIIYQNNRLEVKSIPEFLKFSWSYEFRKSREYCFKAGVVKLQPKTRSISQAVTVNEFLFEPSRAHSFMYCPWLLWHWRGRTTWLWQRPFSLQYLRYLLCPFTEKLCWPTPNVLTYVLLTYVLIINNNNI